ncbi:HNH endonuclease signature motif containing protein [Candidatus Poriferisodalis sp.]|uniref:HNH endonuclease signature motif containing protein n=1 Tax=Candidatus Poriferisodalis sp. TaxID=3101277 RepID=UPI003B52C825
MFIDLSAHRNCGATSAAETAGCVDETDVGRHDAGSSREVDARHDSTADAELGGLSYQDPDVQPFQYQAAAGDVELGELSYRDLKDLVMTLAGERARVEGEYLAALGEMTSRVGAQAAAHQLRELTRMNSSQARSESRLAESLVSHEMTATLDALKSGKILASHAKVIACEAPKKHRRSEEEFLELCRAYPSDTVARHPFAYVSQQVYADIEAEAAAKGLGPIDAELELQRAERSGSMRLGSDGMWHLFATFDFMTGRHLNSAIQSAVRSARRRAQDNNGGSGSRVRSNGCSGDRVGIDVDGSVSGDVEPTQTQLTSDAISDLIAGTSTARRTNTSLMIIADYDVVNDRLVNPRLDDGTPLSAQQLAEYAIDAKVLPAVFKSDWSDLALGRTRNASDAQRLILAARDGGCIGCELTSDHTQSHHIDYFENGGLTEVPNLASMCWDCHTDLHQHDRKIHTPPDGRPHLLPPTPNSNGPPAREPATARSP